MPTGSLTPAPYLTIFDDNGAIVPGGKIYVYLTGTSTPATVYADAALTTPLSNPVIADAAGRLTIYLPTGSFKFIVKTAADVLIRTVDPVQATEANQGDLGIAFIFGGTPDSPVIVTSYPSGATFDKCHAGTAIWRLDSGTLAAGTYVLEAMCLGEGGGTITVGLVNLSDGAPDTAIVECSGSSATGAPATSGPITFPAAGSVKSLAIKTKVNSGAGHAWMIWVRRTA